MQTNERTFSESWHRVADLRVRLHHVVSIRKQLFRGRTWYILQDPFNNHFFRMRAEAYDFVARLDGAKRVEQVWQTCLQRNPDEAPGQQDVIQLLAQLYHANMLYCDLPVDSEKLFERYRRHRQQETRATLLQLMFLRIPLVDPDRWLQSAGGVIRMVTSRWAIFCGLVLMAWAGKTVVENWPRVLHEADGLLGVDNWVLLYLGLILVKGLHEMGHTLACKRFGGQVHAMGIMLLVFAPLPYMDATASWGFRDRRQRICVAAAGMYYEFLAAAVAAMIWAHSGPGTLHCLAYNMMVVASVSTLVFNANPLLRFDGYYILSDLLDLPNLQTRALAQVKHLAVRHLFGDRQFAGAAQSFSEAVWLTAYGVFSGIYRVLVYGGIILLVVDRYFLAGLLMAALCLFTWGVLPIVRLIRYLATSSHLARQRLRAIGVSLAITSILLFFFGHLPMPSHFRAPGVLEAKQHLQVATATPGRLVENLVPNGALVHPGDHLVRLVNPELAVQRRLVAAQREEVKALRQQSRVIDNDRAGHALSQRMANLEERLKKLHDQQQALVVVAEKRGIWVAPDVQRQVGAWFPRGAALGKIVDPRSFRFLAVVSQEEAARLFDERSFEHMAVRLYGQSHTEIPVRDVEVIPFQQQRLPSAALGWGAGGNIPVSHRDAQGLQTVEPYFRIAAELETSVGAEKTAFHHGRSGQIRFRLAAQPLIPQLARKVRQFFQKRYQT